MYLLLLIFETIVLKVLFCAKTKDIKIRGTDTQTLFPLLIHIFSHRIVDEGQSREGTYCGFFIVMFLEKCSFIFETLHTIKYTIFIL